MTDKLVRIATLSKDAVDEIREIEKVTFEDIEKILKREYDLTRVQLDHFLLHLMYEINGSSPKSRVVFGSIYSNTLFLGKGEKNRIVGEGVGRDEVYADTVSRVWLYQEHADIRVLVPPYKAVTYPRAYGRLERAFKEHGFEVGRMQRIAGR